MSTDRRRSAAAGLLLLLSTVFWIWWTPERPERLHDAVSPQAVLVSHHDYIGSRIDLLSTNAAVRAALLGAGVTPKRIRKWREKPQTRFWLEQLLFDRAILIHEPAMAGEAVPGWVAVSWIGKRQARLRLMSGLLGFDDYEKIGRYRGRTLWRSLEDEADGEAIVLGLAEGVVVAVAHPNPLAICDVLDRLDGLRPRMRDSRPDLLERLSPRGEAEDRCMVLLGEPGSQRPLYGSIDLMTRDDLVIAVRGPLVRDAVAAVSSENGGVLPSVRSALLEGVLPANIEPLETPLAFALLGDPHLGRIGFLTVPTLIAGEACPVPHDADRLLRQRAKRMGELFGMELRVEELEAARPSWRLVPEGLEVTRLLKDEQMPAACLLGETLLYGSNHSVLMKLADAWSTRPPLEQGGAGVYLRANLPALGQLARFFLPLWSERARAQGKSDRQIEEVGARLATVGRELDRLPVCELVHRKGATPESRLELRMGSFLSNDPLN